MNRLDKDSVRLDASNTVITARQAVPGTTVVVEGWGFSLITVGRWVAAGDGYARLYDSRGNAHGLYRATDYLECVRPV